jgi:hypothetical protein
VIDSRALSVSGKRNRAQAGKGTLDQTVERLDQTVETYPSLSAPWPRPVDMGVEIRLVLQELHPPAPLHLCRPCVRRIVLGRQEEHVATFRREAARRPEASPSQSRG